MAIPGELSVSLREEEAAWTVETQAVTVTDWVKLGFEDEKVFKKTLTSSQRR